jgi:protein phosphatase
VSPLQQPLRWISSAASDVGRVRQVNEDAYLNRPDVGLWAVADGMGGHDAGDVASGVVVQALKAMPPPVFLGRAVLDLCACLAEANRELKEQASLLGKSIIGSTVAALLAVRATYALVWAGDSRIYRLRRGSLRCLSRDHSQVEDLIEQGLLAREAATLHPAANIVTRAVGAEGELEVDIQTHRARDGDRLLLCTDGLTKEISESEIAATLAGQTAEEGAHALVRCACNRGARDNVTVVVVDCLSYTSSRPVRRSGSPA